MATKFNALGFKFEVIDESKKEVKLTDGHTSKGSITIPETVEYNNNEYTVTEIGEAAFGAVIFPIHQLAAEITSVFIPKTVKIIGSDAFFKCWLREIKGCSGVTNIGSNAFGACRSLYEVTIPSSVKIISRSAFSNCEYLKILNISNGVEIIEEYAFAACYALKDIIIPSSVKTIGKCAFNQPEYPFGFMIIESVSICNDECEVNIAADAFPDNIIPKYVGVKNIKSAVKGGPNPIVSPVVEKKVQEKNVEVKASSAVVDDERDNKLTLNSKMTVADLNALFNKYFGSTVRVYSGRSRQDGNVSLSTLTDKSLDVEMVCNGNLTVAGFIERMQETFGLKVKVYTCDGWVAVLDELTLSASGKVKKNATKADMKSML